jgi:hypothetical protein
MQKESNLTEIGNNLYFGGNSSYGIPYMCLHLLQAVPTTEFGTHSRTGLMRAERPSEHPSEVWLVIAFLYIKV